MATKAKSNAETRAVQKVFALITGVIAILAIALAGMAWWGGSYATNMVHDELSAQNITFPAADAPNFTKEAYPEIHKYAGQAVDNGAKAKAYAEYIKSHLGDITYSEASAAARQDPTNEELKAQVDNLFRGETLRGILLGTGFAYGLIGQIALTAAAVLALVAVLSAVASASLFAAIRRK